MDFSLTDEQRELRELVARVFDDHVEEDLLQRVADSKVQYDQALWSKLSDLGILSVCIPEEYGGSGMGLPEACLVLEEQGRTLAPLPLLTSLIYGAAGLVRYGNGRQKDRYLPRLAKGELIVSAAIEQGILSASYSAVTAQRLNSGWSLNGDLDNVPFAQQSALIIIPACTETGEVKSFLVDGDKQGLEYICQRNSILEPQYRVRLHDCQLDEDAVLEGDGLGTLAGISELANVALCAQQLGVAAEQLRRTVIYVSERNQFNRAIGSFQAVAMQLADCYIDLEAMRSVYWQALWRISAGLKATREVHIARWWCSQAGHRIAHRAQHLHGGIGSDRDYPIHRYFLWSKRLEATLGGASYHLSRLGSHLHDARDSKPDDQ